MIYVIGSGPAGISCAYALVNKGLDVTMLDVGLELEPERARIVKALRATEPEAWHEGVLNSFKENASLAGGGLPTKLAYGSDFAYRTADSRIPVQAKDVTTSASLARGGFSNVWGAAVLPYTSADISDWPIRVEELAPHYEAVLGFMQLAAQQDDLEAVFPLYSGAHHDLRPSRQAAALMKDLEASRAALRAKGVTFGYSRLAVRRRSPFAQAGCVYCGLCMYGCPYELIYNSATTLEELRAHGNFRYLSDVFVERVDESRGCVSIVAGSTRSNEEHAFTGTRAYIACGVLSTTRLLLESLEAYDQSVIMRDSQYFVLPLFRINGVGGVREDRLHTLAQIFLEIEDRGLSDHTIHLQVYTYNDLYRAVMPGVVRKVLDRWEGASGVVLGRLLVVQGYLHSDDSATIGVRLARDGERRALVLEARPNGKTARAIRGIVSKLAGCRRLTRALPLSPFMHIGTPGRGFHSGGTFPMRQEPERYETDVLGRPPGFRRVHAVDATIFPSIPATTISLSVMANAHRIASAHNEM